MINVCFIRITFVLFGVLDLYLFVRVKFKSYRHQSDAMGLFDIENTLIADESMLLEEYVPEEMTHRDGQKQEVANALKPATVGRSISNVFLYGDTGVGKTSLTRWMFRELEKHASTRVKTVYINCWRRQTSHSILTEVLLKLGVFTNLKQPTNELVDSLEKHCEKNSVSLVIALDEVDQLNDEELLYTLSRGGYGLVLISNDAYVFMDSDARIKSSLNLRSVEFPKYSASETTDILRRRCSAALIPGAVKDELLSVIAHKAKGDARVGLDMLKRAVLVAEEKGKAKVELEDVMKSVGEEQFLRRDRILPKLNGDQRILFDIVENSEGISTSSRYEKYCAVAATPIKERTYRKYMESLVKQKIIVAEGEGRWRKYVVL